MARSAAADPATSALAAQSVERRGTAHAHRMICLDAVHEWPGRTSAELAELLRLAGHDLDRWQVARRLPELLPSRRSTGAVVQGAPRKCTARGSRAVTWWPVGMAGPMASAFVETPPERAEARATHPAPHGHTGDLFGGQGLSHV